MAAESLLIRARTAVHGLSQALNDVVRNGARATNNSAEIAENWEKAALRARKAAEYGRQTSDWAGARKQAQDAWREAPGQEWRADLLTPESRAATAGRGKRERAELLAVEREQFWGQDFAGAAGGGAAGGGAEGTSIIAAGKKMLLRFGGPYALWQGVRGGLPGQEGALSADYSTDRLLRSTTGFTDDFSALKDSLDSLGDVVDITNDRFGELALNTAKTAGNISSYESLTLTKAGVEAGRGFGLPDEVMPQWLAEMRWNDAGKQQELLPLIGVAVARAQMPGRSEELLRGILNYTEKTQSLIAQGADWKGYANTVVSMSEFGANNGYPGLKGQGAMSMLDRMDDAVRNPQGQDAELFWYRLFKRKGISDPGRQAMMRAEGISHRPDLIREIMPTIKGEYQMTPGMGEDYDWIAMGRVLGINPLQAKAVDAWARSGGTGSIEGIFKWLEKEGYSADDIKPEAAADVGKLRAIVSGKNAGAGVNRALKDNEELREMGERHLTPEERATLDQTDNEKLVDAILAKLMTRGRDESPADAMRKAMDEPSRLIHHAGSLFNSAASIFVDAVVVFSGFIEQLLAKFGMAEWTPEEQAEYDKSLARLGSRGEGAAGLPALKAVDKYDSLITEASERFGVPKNLIRSVMAAESSGNPNAVSSAGAVGLMQLMPDTATRFKVKDRYDPKQNVMGGTEYLSVLLKKYGGREDLAIAAYNAGENAVKRHGNEIPPYDETIDFVKKVQSTKRLLDQRDLDAKASAAAAADKEKKVAEEKAQKDAAEKEKKDAAEKKRQEDEAKAYEWLRQTREMQERNQGKTPSPSNAAGESRATPSPEPPQTQMPVDDRSSGLMLPSERTGSGWGLVGLNAGWPATATIEIVHRDAQGEVFQTDIRHLSAKSLPYPRPLRMATV